MQVSAGAKLTKHLTLLEPIGKGAMGAVWVAQHSGLKRQVAVKFVTDKRATTDEMRKRFAREAEAARQIRSPHVVRMIEFGQTADKVPYIVMELLRGETLQDRLDRVGKLPLRKTATVLRQVGSALDAAHARGIIHRDIKPDNLFLLKGGDIFVKVLDFGMAKDTRDADEGLTAAGVAVGTPEYMSPEQVLGSRDVDFKSDLWALGVVTYRMVAGDVPFKAKTPQAMAFTICSGEFTALDGTPAPNELEPWFTRIFSRAKEKRFGSAREMVLRFEQTINELDLPEEEDSSFEDEATRLMAGEQISAMARQLRAEQQAGVFELDEPDTIDHMAETHEIEEPPTGDDNLPTTEMAPKEARAMLVEIEKRKAELAAAKTEAASAEDASKAAKQKARLLASDGGDGQQAVTVEARPSSREREQPEAGPKVVLKTASDDDSAPASDDAPDETAAPDSERIDNSADEKPEVDSAARLAETEPGTRSKADKADTDGATDAASKPKSSKSSSVWAAGDKKPAATDDADGDEVEAQAAARGDEDDGGGSKLWLLGLAAAAMVGLAVYFAISRGSETSAEIPPVLPSSASPAKSVVKLQLETASAAPSGASSGAVAAANPSAGAPDGSADAGAASDGSKGKITIICQPACSQVWLDEEPFGPSPIYDKEVPSGTNRFILHRPGVTPQKLEIDVKPGQHVIRTIAMGNRIDVRPPPIGIVPQPPVGVLPQPPRPPPPPPPPPPDLYE